ncbi:MAG: TIGR01777 family protein [Owenweeksia sp.]|nr:TIGR01777 family protein [Owenweeksia sp.]
MKIIITGGSGLIGTEISRQLLDEGHEVVYLSRHPRTNDLGINEYEWNPDTETLDIQAFEDVSGIINLAGASISKKWTSEYKNEILRSRVDGTRLLFETVQSHRFPIRFFISASASGYYPNSYDQEYSEEAPPGNDFLSMVCQKLEQEAQLFEKVGVRSVRMRIGIVLSNKGGALPQIARPVRLGLGAALGDGHQWMPWVHLEDVAAMFVYAATSDSLSGVYNAGGPYNVTNEELSRLVAKVLDKPFFMPNIPKFLLKLALGEMAETALASTKINTDKIQQAGFRYRHTDLEESLSDLLK